MTFEKAVAYTADLTKRIRERANPPLTDVEAWEVAMAICNSSEAMTGVRGRAGRDFFEGSQTLADVWIQERLNRTFSRKDEERVAHWVERIRSVHLLLEVDDPKPLLGKARSKDSKRRYAQLLPARRAARRTPLHSELSQDFLATKLNPEYYRRALEQFREQCGDLPIGEYTTDHCWTFRNWLNTTMDERRGEPLSGYTKNAKLNRASAMFRFAVETRHRNDNPMRYVRHYPRNENRKKRRRLYTKAELAALFVEGQRKKEWTWWAPVLAIYGGLRLRESIQLRPRDISHEFGVWHILVRPGRGQRVKGGKARAVPIHRELIRLGLLDLHKRALREGREWLFKDVPLVELPGAHFNAPDVEAIMVPSVAAASPWFGRYSTKCGVTDHNLDFHALRGLWATYGCQQGKDVLLWMELAGHAKGSKVHQLYIYRGSNLRVLKAEIDRLVYPVKIPKPDALST